MLASVDSKLESPTMLDNTMIEIVNNIIMVHGLTRKHKYALEVLVGMKIAKRTTLEVFL